MEPPLQNRENPPSPAFPCLSHLLDRRQRRARVQHDARFDAQVFDGVDDAVQVDGGRLLGVDRDDVGPGLGKVGDALLGFHDHEVGVQHGVGQGADGVDDEGADGDVCVGGGRELRVSRWLSVGRKRGGACEFALFKKTHSARSGRP